MLISADGSVGSWNDSGRGRVSLLKFFSLSLSLSTFHPTFMVLILYPSLYISLSFLSRSRSLSPYLSVSLSVLLWFSLTNTLSLSLSTSLNQIFSLSICLSLCKAHSTIGGYLCAQAGEIPSSGEVITFSGYRFTVVRTESVCPRTNILFTITEMS